MTPDISLHSKLSEASRRIRILLALKWSMRVTCGVVAAEVLWLLSSRMNWVDEPKPRNLIVLILLALVTGIVVGLTRPFSPMDVARLTDTRTDSKDRLASALEFEKMDSLNPLFVRQISDASKHATTLEIGKAFPIKFSKEAIVAGVLSLFLFLAFFLPTMPIFWSKDKKEEIEEVKKAGIVLEKIAIARGKAADQQKLAETQKAAKDAQKLAEAMKKGGMNKKAAMIQLAKLTKQMEEAQKRIAQTNDPGKKSLSKAGEEVKKALEQQQKAIQASVQAADEKAKAAEGKKQGEKGLKPGEKPGDKSDQKDGQKAGDKKAQKPGEKSGKQMSEGMKAMQLAMQKFSQGLMDQDSQKQAQALDELSKELEKGQMSPSEMGQMAEMMQQMANALKGTELAKAGEHLEQASNAAKSMQLKIDPETLKKLSKMMAEAGGQCKGGPMKLDAKQLAELLQALKDGKLKLAKGNGSGGIPIPIGAGGKGKGTNGSGNKGEKLKNEVANSPKMIAVGKTGSISADSGASKEFLKYAAMGHKDSKFTPNTQVKGTWNQSKSELQQQFRGDPDSEYVSGTPLYSAAQSGVRSVESPVNKEQIPAAYRKQVREYFESINGNGK